MESAADDDPGNSSNFVIDNSSMRVSVGGEPGAAPRAVEVYEKSEVVRTIIRGALAKNFIFQVRVSAGPAGPTALSALRVLWARLTTLPQNTSPDPLVAFASSRRRP